MERGKMGPNSSRKDRDLGTGTKSLRLRNALMRFKDFWGQRALNSPSGRRDQCCLRAVESRPCSMGRDVSGVLGTCSWNSAQCLYLSSVLTCSNNVSRERTRTLHPSFQICNQYNLEKGGNLVEGKTLQKKWSKILQKARKAGSNSKGPFIRRSGGPGDSYVDEVCNRILATTRANVYLAAGGNGAVATYEVLGINH